MKILYLKCNMKQGFFKGFELSEKEIKQKNKKQKKYTCEDCGLYKNCLSPKMKSTGKGKKKILIVAEANGKKEDEKNIQLIGKSGQLLRDYLEDVNLDLDEDFWKTNAICCHPENNRTPNNKEIKCCRKNLFETIEKYKPKVIIPMGKIALESLLGERISGRIKNVNYSDWVGEIIPDQELKVWICPVYHPSYILRNEWDIVLKKIWKKSIDKAIQIVEKPFYIHNYEKDVITYKDKKDAIECMRNIKANGNIVVFDYETTGLKPHREGHKIICCSISDGILSFAFPFFENKDFKKEWRKLIGSKKTFCIAHNARFEGLWTKKILGFSVKNWYWDTMIAQSIIDNRKTTKLKFWTYVKFGVLGYDNEIDKYIRGKKKGEDIKSANAFNLIENVPIKELLKYNALDSLFTYKLYENQLYKIKGILKDGFNLFMKGFQSLLQAQLNGVRINLDLMKKQKVKLKTKLEIIKKKIMDSEELKKWDREKEFEFTSPKQLSYLLYDCLELDVMKKTIKGNSSVDQEVLEKIDLPIVKNILRYRKWEKISSTYFAQYEREQVNDFLHPFFNLGTSGKGRGVKTYRSSCNSPNLQNVFKRNKRAKKMIRGLIIPREGNKLIEYDFKGMEVSTAACYNKDPNLIKYLKDDSTDMHRDCAAELFMCSKEKVNSYERYTAKNKFVFPEFYGSYYEDVTPNLWENIEKDTKDRLKKNGIKNYDQFEDHVMEVERIFWEDKFPVYAEWKKKTIKEYEKKEYVELFTGFRCKGPMKRNEIINYRIQGSAFHILLWTFNQVMKESRKFNKSFLIGQIHDSMLADIYPDDEEEFDYLVWYYGTQKIPECWDWIIVPLKIEKERSAINGNWAEMEDQGYLKGEKE